MITKHEQLALVIFGLSCCLLLAADDESTLMRQNPQWNITKDVFTNAPYWLVPSHVPFRLAPLNNGKWVWTTNMNATWFEFGNSEWKVDITGEQRTKKQWEELHQQMMDAADPSGIANVSEYSNRTWDQKHYWTTNATDNWWGSWSEDTQSGFRVNLCPVKRNNYDIGVIVKVGSVVTNSGPGLLPSSTGKYVKLQLLDSNGNVVLTTRGAAKKLYEVKYGVTAESGKNVLFIHSVARDDLSLEECSPDTIPDLNYTRWADGRFMAYVGFVSNGPPCNIGYINIHEIFSINTEGYYMLTVQPVLYRMHCKGGTFQGYLDRIDLPCVNTRVHLTPNM